MLQAHGPGSNTAGAMVGPGPLSDEKDAADVRPKPGNKLQQVTWTRHHARSIAAHLVGKAKCVLGLFFGRDPQVADDVRRALPHVERTLNERLVYIGHKRPASPSLVATRHCWVNVGMGHAARFLVQPKAHSCRWQRRRFIDSLTRQPFNEARPRGSTVWPR